MYFIKGNLKQLLYLLSVYFFLLTPLSTTAATLTYFETTVSTARFTLDSVVKPVIFSLSSPHRLVIDFPESITATPIVSDASPLSLIKNIRQSIRPNHSLRVVFDLAGPAPNYTYESKMQNGSFVYTLSFGSSTEEKIALSEKQQFKVEEPNKPEPVTVNPDIYIDNLIDPNIAEDTLIPVFDSESSSTSFNLYQTLEFKMDYESSSGTEDSSTVSGLGYSAYKPTANYGNFLLNLVALYEPQDFSFLENDTNDNDFEISHYSLEQMSLPLSSSLSMDNKLGTHRMNNRHHHNTHFISRRFTAAEPEILGVSSRLYQRDTSLIVSYGRLGNSSGRTLRGFSQEGGHLLRTQAQQSFDKHLLSVDFWKTTGRELNTDNRFGYRATLDSLLPYEFRSSVTVAASDNNFNFLAGAEQNKGPFKQGFGLYYSDDDFLWIDRIFNKNNIGGYYLFSNNHQAIKYGGTVEWQHSGFNDEQDDEQKVFLLTSNIGYRLNRTSRINFFYNYRSRDDLRNLTTDASSKSHTLRSNLNLQHNHSTSSNFLLSQRTTLYDEKGKGNDSFFSADYSLNHTFSRGSRADLSLAYDSNDSDANRIDSYKIGAGWQQSFSHGHYLSLSGNYTFSNSSSNHSNSWSGFISHQWNIWDNLFLSTSLNYNQSEFNLESNNSSSLVTDPNSFDDFSSKQDHSFSGTIGLLYQFGRTDNPAILSAHPDKNGSGTVRGRVFIDENGDGIAQSNEKGLASVDVYLDSVYPIRTDNNGEFSFASVGIGEHHLFIDESILPLPWGLDGEEHLNINVNLRSTSIINIPISAIGLAE